MHGNARTDVLSNASRSSKPVKAYPRGQPLLQGAPIPFSNLRLVAHNVPLHRLLFKVLDRRNGTSEALHRERKLLVLVELVYESLAIDGTHVEHIGPVACLVV